MPQKKAPRAIRVGSCLFNSATYREVLAWFRADKPWFHKPGQHGEERCARVHASPSAQGFLHSFQPTAKYPVSVHPPAPPYRDASARDRVVSHPRLAASPRPPIVRRCWPRGPLRAARTHTPAFSVAAAVRVEAAPSQRGRFDVTDTAGREGEVLGVRLFLGRVHGEQLAVGELLAAR